MPTARDLLSRYQVPTKDHGEHHHVSAGWTGFDCPYCSAGSGRFRAALSPTGRAANCWTCGPLPLLKTLRELTGEGLDELRRLLGSVREVSGPQVLRRREVLLPPGLGDLLPCHRLYLRRRGFDPDKLARVWGLQGIGLASRLAWRLFVPIHLGGRLVSYTTRSLADDGIRYVTAETDDEVLPARTLLYGGDYARNAAVVVEGPSDAWRVGPGAVATLGVAYTHAQLARLARLPVRVICFDADPAGQARARKLCDALSALPGRTVNVVLDAKDPGSASAREVRRLREEFLE